MVGFRGLVFGLVVALVGVSELAAQIPTAQILSRISRRSELSADHGAIEGNHAYTKSHYYNPFKAACTRYAGATGTWLCCKYDIITNPSYTSADWNTDWDYASTNATAAAVAAATEGAIDARFNVLDERLCEVEAGYIACEQPIDDLWAYQGNNQAEIDALLSAADNALNEYDTAVAEYEAAMSDLDDEGYEFSLSTSLIDGVCSDIESKIAAMKLSVFYSLYQC